MRDHQQVSTLTAVCPVFATALQANAASVNGAGRHRHAHRLPLPGRGDAIGDRLGRAAERVFGRYIDGDCKVFALAHAVRRAPAHAAEALAPIAAKGTVTVEDAAEDFAPAAGARAAGVGIRTARATTRHAAEHQHLVVLFALLLIGQRLVRLADLFKLVLVATRIWMVFLSKLAECALDFFLGGVALHPEHIVKGLLRHGACPLSSFIFPNVIKRTRFVLSPCR